MNIGADTTSCLSTPVRMRTWAQTPQVRECTPSYLGVAGQAQDALETAPFCTKGSDCQHQGHPTWNPDPPPSGGLPKDTKPPPGHTADLYQVAAQAPSEGRTQESCRCPSEGPGPARGSLAPLLEGTRPGQETPKTFLQHRWRGHTQKPMATGLPLPTSSPSPAPYPPPGEAPNFRTGNC